MSNIPSNSSIFVNEGENILVRPLPLMSKEESILVLLDISIRFYNLM